jgi:pimeloyl-ACP methyl ester carboxylesterase
MMVSQLATAISAIRAAAIPYTIIAGDQGDATFRAWIAAFLPQATLTVWPACGHFPHLAQPAAFARILASALPETFTGSADMPRCLPPHSIL